jgi:inosine/xanthosine triphosphatase
VITIAVGSKNPTKVEAVKQVFEKDTIVVKGLQVASGVSEQPFSDQDTRAGAIHRARECVKAGADAGIGLEGGVMESEAGMLSVNWGALVDQNGRQIIASGARYPLPEEIAKGVRQGNELGEVIDEFTARKDVRKKEGAVGIFTNGLITRNELYVHIVRLLAGQYQFYDQKRLIVKRMFAKIKADNEHRHRIADIGEVKVVEENKILEGIYNIQKEVHNIHKEVHNIQQEQEKTNQRLGNLESKFDRFQVETNETLADIKKSQRRFQKQIDVFIERVIENSDEIGVLKKAIQ